jgi:hypothetical protein
MEADASCYLMVVDVSMRRKEEEKLLDRFAVRYRGLCACPLAGLQSDVYSRTHILLS